MKKILTNKDINFNSRSELINIQEECVFIIKSKLVSLENIIFFYTKILPTILLKNKNNIIVSPDFPGLKKYSNEAKAAFILLNSDYITNKIIELYENKAFE